jgi:cation diffusion facilitator family transporter
MAHSNDDAGVRRALIAGIAANFGVAVAKFVAFFFTGSAAMFAESLHSVADSSNQALLFVGIKLSRKAPTESHPFGYAKERYFYSFVVALVIFLVGAVVAMYEGVQKIRHPHPMENVVWNYGALAIGFLFEAFALRIAWREFRHWRASSNESLLQSLRTAKDLALPTVLFEDSAALVGLVAAAVGVTMTQVTGNGVYDGIASIVIGVVLLGVSVFLTLESHSLLVGEAASPNDRRRVRAVVQEDPAVLGLIELLTLQRGPDSIVVALELHFADHLTVDDVEDAVRRLEKKIQAVVPAASHIFIEAGSFRRRGSHDPAPDGT